MLIDWFTVGAQALNFVLLVWLLKRFLYKPILDAVDTREKRIAAELADADSKKAEAQKEHAEYQQRIAQFDQQRATLLSQATHEVGVERQKLLDEANAAADAAATKRQLTLRTEVHDLTQALRQRTQQEVFAIARKALADLATTSLEERMSEVFTRRLRAMNGKSKEALAGALKAASEPALVRSAFDLPPAQRAIVQNALNETFSAEVRIRFETTPELVSGIEFTTNGQRIGWSIAEYLSSLEGAVDALVKKGDPPDAAVAAMSVARDVHTPEMLLVE
jgi:F-type H+-transporting ATPase subunit b